VKAFEHFWKRIADAYDETKNAELGAMLKFRDLYLLTDDRKESLASIVGIEPFGKDGKPTFCARRDSGPVPLAGRTITFQVGATSPHVYADGSPLRAYWKTQFNRERFAESPAGEGEGSANRGACLVTGAVNVPIAEVHRTLIKGIPGLPPIGGYIVSFDEASPALRSYGFERCWNAPVSEDAAAAYALGLNDLLGSRDTAKKIQNAVLCSWVDIDRDAAVSYMNLLDAPTRDSRSKFFAEFESGRFSHLLDASRYRSLTLAANGGRVVIRRWLDEPLNEAVEAARRWFDDLGIDTIEVPKKAQKPGKRKASADDPPAAPEAEPTHNPYSIYYLASTTARIPSEVQTTTYDILYRAAIEPGRFCPLSLLAPVLQRLKIAAAERGNAIRFNTSRFALLKLILKRSGDCPMPVEHVLCEETNDPAYNCGRLLAVLDDLQRAAQGQVGADIVSRFYGAASTYPAQVFQTILKLAKAHENKLKKSANPRLRNKGYALTSRINDILSRFQPDGDGKAPGFPTVLSPKEQGRFALGFHQQKAADERAVKAYLAAKAAGQTPDDPTLDALAETQSETPVTAD
jgi:CRISPR-associated protein Csd1